MILTILVLPNQWITILSNTWSVLTVRWDPWVGTAFHLKRILWLWLESNMSDHAWILEINQWFCFSYRKKKQSFNQFGLASIMFWPIRISFNQFEQFQKRLHNLDEFLQIGTSLDKFENKQSWRNVWINDAKWRCLFWILELHFPFKEQTTYFCTAFETERSGSRFWQIS